MKKKDDSTTIEDCTLIIANGAEFERIAVPLASFGYDRNKMNEGEALLQNAKTILNTHGRAICSRKESLRSFAVAWKELETAYRKVRKLAKIKFDSQPEVVARLNLKGKVPQLYVPFMATVETLVSGVTADQSLLDQLKPLQISEYTIYDLEQGIRKTKELRTEYLHKKSETQRITAEKQKAIAELFCWCSNYIKMARIAMADTPQLLEALGIVVKR